MWLPIQIKQEHFFFIQVNFFQTTSWGSLTHLRLTLSIIRSSPPTRENGPNFGFAMHVRKHNSFEITSVAPSSLSFSFLTQLGLDF